MRDLPDKHRLLIEIWLQAVVEQIVQTTSI